MPIEDESGLFKALAVACLAGIPLFMATFYVNNSWGTTATTTIFILIASTGWLDWYMRTRLVMGSLDVPLNDLAEKLIVTVATFLVCTRPLEVAALGQMPWILHIPAFAVICLEITTFLTIITWKEWAGFGKELFRHEVFEDLRRWKRASQMTALIFLLASRDSSYSSEGNTLSGVILLYISVGLAVASIVLHFNLIFALAIASAIASLSGGSVARTTHTQN
ncbi:CDP-diacylglycerol--glycerol-3-phosphate 3-phosphatidyltransferase [Bertholletia excelsa]